MAITPLRAPRASLRWPSTRLQGSPPTSLRGNTRERASRRRMASCGAVCERCMYRCAVSMLSCPASAWNDRPGLQELMAAARRGKLDAVLVWKLDRFGRSALDVLANIRDLDAAGVMFIATTQGIDIRPGGDAMSRLILGVLASVAEFERDLIRERTQLGMAKAREAGKKIGRPAVQRPDHADVARLRAQGKSWREVSEALGCSTWAAREAA
jgi:putative DNA-invertase from lambdoid prophage Rac